MKGPVQAAVVPQLTRGAYWRGIAGILPFRQGLSHSGPQPAPGELIAGHMRAGCRRKFVPAAMVTYRMLSCSSLQHAQKVGRDPRGPYGHMERNIAVKYRFNNVRRSAFCKIPKPVWKSCPKCLTEMFERKNVSTDRSPTAGPGPIFDSLSVPRAANFVLDLSWSLTHQYDHVISKLPAKIVHVINQECFLEIMLR